MDMAGNTELSGKVAIVTGAGRNIGHAIALALAEGGASILVNARSNRPEADAVAREVEAKGGKALVHIGDVVDGAAVQAMADAGRERFWRPCILLHKGPPRGGETFSVMKKSGRGGKFSRPPGGAVFFPQSPL